MDNLLAQTTDEFKMTLAEDLNASVWLLPPGCTDEAQPVDAGHQGLLIVVVGMNLELFLDQNDDLDKWETKLDLRVQATTRYHSVGGEYRRAH